MHIYSHLHVQNRITYSKQENEQLYIDAVVLSVLHKMCIRNRDLFYKTDCTEQNLWATSKGYSHPVYLIKDLA